MLNFTLLFANQDAYLNIKQSYTLTSLDGEHLHVLRIENSELMLFIIVFFKLVAWVK